MAVKKVAIILSVDEGDPASEEDNARLNDAGSHVMHLLDFIGKTGPFHVAVDLTSVDEAERLLDEDDMADLEHIEVL